ncbi:hypothetical protein [Rubellimicrobium roseum]|uniref:HIRAN domain-containing protein n=1 Tax=Rubellimicrobium roseum TaxID=687525 RepID=A0A5C4NA66_9RHOB|nr:hypothetical protein [Rubellimicrobium roseum]TNC64917.1 hypothetical protein FHG71_18315 [Rubellimicrobium roseum]
MDLDIGEAASVAPRVRTRKAALDALERLLRAHAALSEHRDPESSYGILRGATDEELDLVEAVFLHCGVPLPDTLRAIYRRTLGVGNPVASTPVLTVPFLSAALPDEGFGSPIVGIEAFEMDLKVFRDELAYERPPFLHLGHAAPAGLTVSRNGLWSVKDYAQRHHLPALEDFNLVFETAFCAFVDQVLVLWANDLAGAPVRSRDLDLAHGARLAGMPADVQTAIGRLVAPRTLSPRTWSEAQPIDNPDLLRATRRAVDHRSADLLTSHLAVVGLPYVERPELVARIVPGDLLRLRPVDNNPHDPNAVEVWHDGVTSIRVGFIERKDAPMVRALPPDPAAWRLRVTDRSNRVLVAQLERTPPEEESLLGANGPAQREESDSQLQDLFSQLPCSRG